MYGPRPIELSLYEECLAIASDALPRDPDSQRSPGVGIVIFHQGRDVHDLVLAWWTNENELPIRVFVRPFADDAWRRAHDHESICVWDLEVLWFEREAYVRHVLTPPRPEQPPDIEAYLATQLHTPNPATPSDPR